MGHPVISIPSTYRQDHLFTSIVFLFVFLLFLSFVRNYPLCFFFSFIDTIFLIFYCCSSLTLFKVNNNIESVTIKEPINRRSLYSRSSGRLSASSINIFSVRTSKKYNSMERNSFGIESLSDMDLSASPYSKSPWSAHLNTNRSSFFEDGNVDNYSPNVLMGSLVREGGHIYSLAASGELLYTGSDSKNIRVWKNNREFSGFRSNSGLVKAIVISGDRIFTGHQDGKIRMWRISSRNPSVHRRVGTLPSFKDYINHSMRPSSYVEIRRHKSVLWLKHLDAISCLSFNEDRTIIYSASWDKTFKVWRISDSKCLESVTAHDDAVNSLVAGFDGLVFTGSADGTVKVWRREMQGKGTKHFFSQTLLKQECAVTALAVNPDGTVIYAGSSDGLVNFWDRKSHLSHGGILMGHKLAVLCLVAAGNLLFSGSADMGICVWSRMGSDHVCLSLLTGHSGPIKCLAAARDHESVSRERRWILYSGSLDKSVRMWRISEFGPPMPFKGCAGSAPTVLRAAPSFSTQGRISEAKH